MLRRLMGVKRLWIRGAGGATFALGCMVALPAAAQSWEPPRTRPFLLEIGAVDATGESQWIFGAEDVAGDGLDRFRVQEQAIDFRTVYAAAGGQDLWLRAYVSSSSGAGDVRLFVFVDNDRNAASGGSARATDLDERFDSDPTPGGYEYVVAVRSDETLEGVWRWSNTAGAYEPEDDPIVLVESGTDEDPIRIGAASHGYVQLSLPLAALGLDSSCNADLFVRTLSEASALGPGDLDVGRRARCVPVAASQRGLPEVLVPSSACSDDAQCPGGGLCLEGRCVIPPLCREDGDCGSDEVCDEGLCVFDASATLCAGDSACGDLVCDSDAGVCTACSTDSSCGAGRRCAPTGRCVDGSDAIEPTDGDGLGLAEGEKIQGGAFTCQWSGRPAKGTPGGPGRPWPLGAFAWAAALGGVATWRRRAGARRHQA